jgi:hypothetical protein
MKQVGDETDAREVDAAPDGGRITGPGISARQVIPGAIMILAVIALLALGLKHPGRAQSGPPPAWVSHLQRMEEALARQDVRGAIRPCNEAYSAAVKSEGWEGLAAVGEAYLRLAERAGDDQRTARALPTPIVARRIFEGVLSRAQGQGSVEGVLHAAAGFRALGDLGAAERCVHMAWHLEWSRRAPGPEMPQCETCVPGHPW